ncbi:MAG: FimB/Mfa2 family fimbrial subunit [Rikenellaceae bacterium]
MRKIAAIILSLTAMVGCFDVEIYNTEHPDTAEVQIAVDMPVDGVYTVVLEGVAYELVDGAIQFPDYFTPGEYSVFAFNEVDCVSVGCTATSAVASVELSGEAINSNLGTLYFGQQSLVVTPDNVISYTLNVEQVTAQVNIELTLAGSAFVDLKGIYAQLDGVAQQWDCLAGCSYGAGGYVEPTLKQVESLSVARSGDVASVVVAGSLTLIGLVENESQTLTIELSYADGSTTPIVSDVSSQLATLNQNKTTTITLTGEYETEVSGAVDGGVVDWVVEDNSDDVLDLF